MLDRPSSLLFGDHLDRAMLGEDANVVPDVGEVLVHRHRQFLGAAHFLRLDVEPQQPFPQRMLEEKVQRVLRARWFLPTAHRLLLSGWRNCPAARGQERSTRSPPPTPRLLPPAPRRV